MYSDMTARDLLQRRSTGSTGSTLWEPTPLTVALQLGRLCILDGIQRLPPGSISALLRLIEDREVRPDNPILDISYCHQPLTGAPNLRPGPDHPVRRHSVCPTCPVRR